MFLLIIWLVGMPFFTGWSYMANPPAKGEMGVMLFCSFIWPISLLIILGAWFAQATRSR